MELIIWNSLEACTPIWPTGNSPTLTPHPLQRIYIYMHFHVPLHQLHLSLAIDKAAQAQVLSSALSTHSHALVLSTSLPHAGDWLNGVASPTLGLHLDDQEFRCCLRYWQGIPLHSSPYSCPECRGTADQFGTIKLAVEGMLTG